MFYYNDINDVYCSIIKYSDFIIDPEKHINVAYEKRDSEAFEIIKLPDEGTPKISA